VSAPGIRVREFARRSNCDEKQVRRAIGAGKLKVNQDGTLDPAQLEIGWRRPIRSSKVVADTSEVSAQSVRTSSKVSAPEIKDDDTPAQAAAKIIAAMGAEHDLPEAIRIKENYNALLKQLEYEQKSGSLVELEVAESVIFNAGRAWRDSWLNWPARIGPMLAADLGLEADKVTEALTAHVHKQISVLGEPDTNFKG